MRLARLHALAFGLAPALLIVAGCGGRVSAFGGLTAARVSIHVASSRVDTNGSTRLTALLADGNAAKVRWSVWGGDPRAGAGRVSADGVYTPPSYLTRDAVTVQVRAQLVDATGGTASDAAELTVTPGFLQPLTPGNLSVGPGGSVTISGSMTEVGGSAGIRFLLAESSNGDELGPKVGLGPGAVGSLSAPRCVRNAVTGPNPAYTVCSVTYAAPAVIGASKTIFIVGRIVGNGADASPTTSWTRVLLNAGGVSSNPATHQAHLAVPVQLGSSSGNNMDYDASLGQLSDCCGGTLGALVQDGLGNQFVLSNNHVLARSDQSIPGETVIQPGLIDNSCTPYGVGPGTTPVASLTRYPALSQAGTNVDAAIARVTPGAVDTRGSILELGARQPDGTLAAAPPGVSSSSGKGEAATLGMMVAKSGRTTGLTCAEVSAVSVDVVVDYFTDCAETAHAFTKTFTNQIAIAGPSFSDAGDSGALVVNSANAEPVGLFFAGGTDTHGVEQAIASPIGDVLSSLDALVPGTASTGAASYRVVGGTDHPVACLSYGGAHALDEKAASLSVPERERGEAALGLAQLLINPATGVVRTSVSTSLDHPGEAAIALYVDAGAAGATAYPNQIGGVTTKLIVNAGIAGEVEPTHPRGALLNQALAVKQESAAGLFRSNLAIFGVGVGQSLDNPREAAVMLYVDRKKFAGKLPETIEGQRVRVVLMDRLHVTRSHGTALPMHSACAASQRLMDPFASGVKEDLKLLRDVPSK